MIDFRGLRQRHRAARVHAQTEDFRRAGHAHHVAAAQAQRDRHAVAVQARGAVRHAQRVAAHHRGARTVRAVARGHRRQERRSKAGRVAVGERAYRLHILRGQREGAIGHRAHAYRGVVVVKAHVAAQVGAHAAGYGVAVAVGHRRRRA